MDPKEIVAELWRRMEARDWDGVGDLVADDFVLDWPESRERIRGRDNFVELNRNYPEGWSIEVLQIVTEGDRVVSEVRVPHGELGLHYASSFFEVEGGRLARGREYWSRELDEEPPAWRSKWVERL
jgi:ketosteroid isomerase-like protein